MNRSAAATLRRWDQMALTQLCRAAATLVEENDRLRDDLARADDAAEFWREQALEMQMQLVADVGGSPGITRDCKLVVCVSDGTKAEQI